MRKFIVASLIVSIATFSSYLLKSYHVDQTFDGLMGKKTASWGSIQTYKDFQDLDFYKEIYNKNKDHIVSRSAVTRIPKIIHFIWLGPLNLPQASIDSMFSWKKLHPDWQFVFWTDRERTAIFDGMEVRQVTDALFTRLSEQYHVSLNYGEKSDILRLEILNKEGGIYMDHDALCLHAFDPLCESFDFFVGLERPHAGIYSSIFPCIGMFGSVPSHPILQDTINRISDSWEESTKQYLHESVATLVVQRTFKNFTLSVRSLLGKTGYKDIPLPASYFFAYDFFFTKTC